MKRKLLEILPGGLAWGSLGILVLFSFIKPVWVAVFIIFFDCYWLFKTVFLYFHLQLAFRKMRLNLKINWLEKLNQDSDLKIKNWREIYHLIILPMYKEDYEVVRESFSRLKAVNYPKEKMIIVLGIEERAGEIAEETARKIEKEFSRFFFKFLITEHPANLPGEIAGKGSNETWAIKEAKKNIIDFLKIPYENILVSSFDVDTQPGSDYFGILTYKFLIAEKPQHSSYQPIPLFTNNVYQAPAFARVVSFCTTSWAMMRQAWQERLRTFSSHSVPFKPLIEVGFWQTDIVSEDSRIFWQLFLHFDGDWRTEPLFYPVGMDANMAPTFWQTLKNLYRQQRRWAWGPCENIPYFLSGWRGRKISWRQKVYHALVLIEDAHAWATNALIIFIFGRLPVYAGGEAFRVTLLSVNLPRVTGFIISLTSVGIIVLAFLSFLLLPTRPVQFKNYQYIFYVIQWLLLPFCLVIFGCFPALEAQTRLMLSKKFHLGFWHTPKSRVY